MEHWLKAAGAVGLDDLELAEFPAVGRGIKTLRNFDDGEKIVTLPHSALWTVKHAYDDPLLGPALRSIHPPLSTDDTLAVYILFVRSRKSGYDGLRCHVTALPTSYSSSILFNEDELNVCAGSSLYAVTKQLEQQIEEDYKALVIRLFAADRALFPVEKFTINDYKWALCTVWSRAMDFELADGSSIRILAPFIDMLNHSPEVKQCHIYDPRSGDLSILAGKDYKVGDQVFIYYGPIPNNRLLRLYGFIVPGNPNDSYDLVLSTHASAPLFDQKHKLWVQTGLNSTTTISLTLADPLPKSVLRYLRIQRLNESDLAELKQIDVEDEKISDSNEVEVLQFLIESIQFQLENFGTQLEKLEGELANGFYSPPGGNKWAAAHVSLGEQKVLRSAKKSAEDMLATVESGSDPRRGLVSAATQCANCGTVLAQPKYCAKCKAVIYCGRACQVAHYKKHKAACLETIERKQNI